MESDWRAALQAACDHEFVPPWLRKRQRGLRSGSWPAVLELGVNGAGIAGTYRLASSRSSPCYTCNQVPDVRLEFSPTLGLWVLTSQPGPNGEDDRAEKSRVFYQLGKARGRQLLYVGSPNQDLMLVEWVPVLGQAPPPRIHTHISEKLLTLDTVSLGGGARISAETASSVLACLLDLSTTRLRSCIRTRIATSCDWKCDTAPHVAVWLHEHAGDAGKLAAVCPAWCKLVRLYQRQWPQDILRLFQLDGNHGWPVASPSQVLQVLARTSWQNMLHLTDFPAFRDNAWPVHVTSVALKMPVKSQPDNYLDFSTLRELRSPFAVFAWKLLHDVPLPWAKMLATRPTVREGMTSSRTSPIDNETKTLTADLLYESCLQGAQHLANTTGLLVTPGGFVTRSGCPVRRRVGAALRELARTVPSLCLTGWSQGWSSSFRDGTQLCFFCEHQDADEERCPQCKDTRSWSTLSATFSMSFSVEVQGDPSQVEFAIEARAVPFMSISSDVQIYSRLEEITGTRRDCEDETDIDEGGLCDDDGLEGNGERDEGARTDDLVAAREEEPKDTGDSDRSTEDLSSRSEPSEDSRHSPASSDS